MAKNRFTQADIDRLRVKGVKVIDTTTPSNTTGIKQPASFALGRLKAGAMNKTEAAYANYLEKQKQFGDVAWYAFEPMNLKLADKCFYRVDFLVMLKSGQLECHEIKGFLTDDSLVKFKVAGQKFPFVFRMIALKKGVWVEKYNNL